jgi:hypothetical protein
MVAVLNIQDCNEIKVLEVLDIGLGEEKTKGSLIAEFPCEITWTDPDTPSEIASIEKSLQKTDTVWVSDWSKSHITPGIYIRLRDSRILFQKKD